MQQWREPCENLDCDKCGGNEFIYDPELNIARECECRILRQQERAKRFACIPEKYSNAMFHNMSMELYIDQENRKLFQEIKEIVENYIIYFNDSKESGRGLYFYSKNYGTGKTRMLATIANELRERLGTMCKFTTSGALIQEIKNSWDKDGEYTESEIFGQMIRADVLIIDDFGMEKQKPWINEKMFYVINERYKDKKITCYSSNYALDDLEYDGRIKNRIVETCLPLKFPEESVRDTIAIIHNRRKER